MFSKFSKLPRVVETCDSFSINGHEVPGVLEHGVKVDHEGEYVKVTVTFLARSYKYKPSRMRHKNLYNFHKPLKQRLFSLFK